MTFKRRAYRGQRSTDTATFRLVGLRNEATGEYHCYLTNLPAGLTINSHLGFNPPEMDILVGSRGIRAIRAFVMESDRIVIPIW